MSAHHHCPLFLANAILRQTKDDFMAGLVDFAPTTTESQNPLKALDDKIEEISTWITEYKLRVKRDERAHRKARKEEQLQAIYQNSQADNFPGYTAELATVLLESGFLRAEEIGKLCLLTGKFLLAHLPHNFVWKKIFEARFNYKAENGLTYLYQSQKFGKILSEKGYEWMFRHIFAQHDRDNADEEDAESSTSSTSTNDEENHTSNGTINDSDITRLIVNGQDLDIQVNHDRLPDSALNKQNFFFVALIESRDAYGFPQPIHAMVLDDEKEIDALMTGENVFYKAVFPSNDAERIKSPLDQYERYTLGEEAGKRRSVWKNELQKRFQVDPRSFHPGIAAALREQETTRTPGGGPLLVFMFHFQISIFAFRMDSYECKLVCGGPPETFHRDYDSSLGHIIVTEGNHLPLNGIGKDMAKSFLTRASDVNWDGNATMRMNQIVNIESNENQNEFRACFTAFETNNDYFDGLAVQPWDMYRVLDYGMHWS